MLKLNQIPEHERPFPWNPFLQVHEYDPRVFLHSAFLSQSLLMHSSTSREKDKVIVSRAVGHLFIALIVTRWKCFAVILYLMTASIKFWYIAVP